MEDQIKAGFFAGRLEIPLEMQRRLGLQEGSCMSLHVEDGRLIGETVLPTSSEETVAALKDLSRLRDVISRGPSLSDAFIAYRQEDLLAQNLEELLGLCRSDLDLVTELQRERRQDKW